jgi:hypothetical protein
MMEFDLTSSPADVRFEQSHVLAKLDRIWHVLAEQLQARGKLDLEEAFIDGSHS